MEIGEFNRLLRQMGEELYRDMPWRADTRPYYVLVSELMLQQTQVSRVIPKFEAFITVFPDEKALAQASLAEVLGHWQGLGYNRRAKFLHDAAKQVVTLGHFPDTYDELVELPGVGKNTAGAILAYSFNHSTLFIETNIRTVYIHHFFADDFAVDDKEILAKLAETLDDQPRRFYWALMDYGSWLKASGIRNTDKSRHYKKQSRLEGSLRQMRGEIIRRLAGGQGLDKLADDDRYERALAGLLRDELIVQDKAGFHLTK